MLWIIYALLSAIFLSLSEIFQKKGLFKEHALEFNILKFGFATIILIIVLFFVEFKQIPLYLWGLAVLANTFGAIGNLYRSKAYKHMEISSAAPFFNLSPAIVAIFAFFFLGEVLNLSQIMGIIILVIGTYLLEIDFDKHSVLDPIKKMIKSKYIHFIFITLIVFAFAANLDRKVLTSNVSPIQYLFIAVIVILIDYLIYALIKYGIEGIKTSFRKPKKEAFISAIFWITEMIFAFKAFSLYLIGPVVAVKRLNTLFTTIFGGRLFKEKGLYWKGVVCLIMFFGIYLIII